MNCDAKCVVISSRNVGQFLYWSNVSHSSI